MKEFFFSAKGRISRKQFWLNFVLPMLGVYLVVAIVVGGLMAVAGGGDNPAILGLVGLIALPVYIGVVWASVCVGSKRFHDRNMSGWWVLWFMLIGIAIVVLQQGAILVMGPEAGAIVILLLSLVSLIASIAQLVILGFLPGTKGPNQYGPDPLDPNAAASAEEVFS